MAYFIRDDRLTVDEAARANHGKAEDSKYLVRGFKKAHYTRDAENNLIAIHSAPTVMHDRCCHENIAGVEHDASIEDPHERLAASFAARDGFAEAFGPGHSLCWGPVWSVKDDAAPCFFCGEPVVGRG
jgi:hypothetical protein